MRLEKARKEAAEELSRPLGTLHVTMVYASICKNINGTE